ncbi:hypothetical protein D3C80_1632790 [compost metagenome]
MHLQLFVQLLGLGQHFLQAMTVTRSLDGRSDVAGDQLQQLDVTVVQRAQKTQFDDTVDPVVVAGRHHQHTARQTFAKPGTDLEVIGRNLIEADQPCPLRHLADNAFVTVNLLVEGLLFTGETVGRHAFEAPVLFANINRTHSHAKVLRAK